MRRFLLLLTLLLTLPILVWAKNITEKDFHSDVVKTYNFQPHTLNQKEIDQKSLELDIFWKKVESNKSLYLPLLKSELRNTSNPSYYFYDGSKLLLSLSKEKEDKLIALQAIPRADLQDLQFTDYLLTVHSLAKEGFDTSEAALRILDYPDVTAIIPQHALTLGQDYSLIYMLIPTEETFYLKKLVARLEKEKNEKAQRSLLLMLWYTVTETGNQALTNYYKNELNPKVTRGYAKELLDRNSNSGSILSLSLKSYSSLKQKRREAMSIISDEALIDFDKLTMKMLKK
jgi:hypothetical protein